MPCSCLSRASIPLNRADASAYVMLGTRGALRSHLMIIGPVGWNCLARQLVPVRVRRHQSRSALAVSPGLLSQRVNCGKPWVAAILSRQATVASAPVEWAAGLARDSRVNSSTTWRILMVRPVTVTPDW
jgi:hypothetical protein